MTRFIKHLALLAGHDLVNEQSQFRGDSFRKQKSKVRWKLELYNLRGIVQFYSFLPHERWFS